MLTWKCTVCQANARIDRITRPNDYISPRVQAPTFLQQTDTNAQPQPQPVSNEGASQMTQKSAQAVVRALQFPSQAPQPHSSTPGTSSTETTALVPSPTVEAQPSGPFFAQTAKESGVASGSSLQKGQAATRREGNGNAAMLSEEQWKDKERAMAKERVDREKEIEKAKIREITGAAHGRKELAQIKLLRELAQSPRDRANHRRTAAGAEGAGGNKGGSDGDAAVGGEKDRHQVRVQSDYDASQALRANEIRDLERERSRREELERQMQEATMVAEQMQRAQDIAEKERYLALASQTLLSPLQYAFVRARRERGRGR